LDSGEEGMKTDEYVDGEHFIFYSLYMVNGRHKVISAAKSKNSCLARM
jgi:hypothetical protein